VAIDYLEEIGMENIRAHEIELTEYALERLGEEADVEIFGPRDAHKKGGVVAFNIGDVHSHDVAAVLDSEGVYVRVGHHCCQPIMHRLDIPGTARASFYIYNDQEDIDRLVASLASVRRIFG
jgi:cysteine desulfurase/selenocysteine lyase